MTEQRTDPFIEFFQLVEGGRPPRRADRAAGGTLPTRAFRYCEAVTTAAALGWYVFPPIAFSLFWTGTEILWTFDGETRWHPLGAAQFPDFSNRFNANAPAEVQNYSPPFLGALLEPGIIQVWSGLIVRTRPGWSLLARGPANLPRAVGYDVFEGVIEADRWFGPLFINLKLTRTGSPILFDPNLPLFQVQPLRRSDYRDEVLDNFAVGGLETMTSKEWDSYYRTVVQPSQARCPLGVHAASVRKQRHADSVALRSSAAISSKDVIPVS